MTERLQALIDARELVTERRQTFAKVILPIWEKLYRVTEYLEQQEALELGAIKEILQ